MVRFPSGTVTASGCSVGVIRTAYGLGPAVASGVRGGANVNSTVPVVPGYRRKVAGSDRRPGGDGRRPVRSDIRRPRRRCCAARSRTRVLLPGSTVAEAGSREVHRLTVAHASRGPDGDVRSRQGQTWRARTGHPRAPVRSVAPAPRSSDQDELGVGVGVHQGAPAQGVPVGLLGPDVCSSSAGELPGVAQLRAGPAAVASPSPPTTSGITPSARRPCLHLREERAVLEVQGAGEPGGWPRGRCTRRSGRARAGGWGRERRLSLAAVPRWSSGPG